MQHTRDMLPYCRESCSARTSSSATIFIPACTNGSTAPHRKQQPKSSRRNQAPCSSKAEPGGSTHNMGEGSCYASSPFSCLLIKTSWQSELTFKFPTANIRKSYQCSDVTFSYSQARHFLLTAPTLTLQLHELYLTVKNNHCIVVVCWAPNDV